MTDPNAIVPEIERDEMEYDVVATDDKFWLLSKTGGRKLPVPPDMQTRAM